jgi:alkylhydroperoxidase/carboxymuconolactone decarboxylase family protein YurZ
MKTSFYQDRRSGGDDMFEDINEIRKARKKYNYQMFQSGISTFNEMEQLEANVFQPGSLARKYKELIALGISIAQACYG